MDYPVRGSNPLNIFMEVQVIPISIPQIDFKNLIDRASLFLERSPVRDLDAKRMETQSFLGYLRILGSIEQEKNIRLGWHILSQLSFGFLIKAPINTIADLSICHYVTAASNKTFAVVSSTLADWHELSLRNCTEFSEINLRRVYCQVVLLLEQAGLGAIWNGTKKQMLEDGTFSLCKS